MKKVIVIGGGISGLSAAWELQQRGIDYTLLEASDRLGGKLITDRSDGFIIEGGADSFLTSKRAAWELCREIDFTDQLIGTNPLQKNVYIWKGGRMHPFPRGMRLIVPIDPVGLLESDLFSESGKQRMLEEIDIPPRQDVSDESLASFVRRRFGEEALEVLGESLLAGIHVADPEQLSIGATFPNYVHFERTYGSVTAGARQAASIAPDPAMPHSTFVAPQRGMAELIEALGSALTGDIRFGTAVCGIDSDRTLTLQDGDKLKADGVLLTTPAATARTLLQAIAPGAAALLGALRAVSSATVTLGFQSEEIDHPLDGYGFVIPHREGTRISACTWSSTKLAGRAPAGYVLLRVFFGGFGRESDVLLPDRTLIEIALRELATTMNIHAQPVITRIFRWQQASPQYDVNHVERLRAPPIPGWLQLAGCWLDGVGVPDCVRQGRSAAEKLSEELG